MSRTEWEAVLTAPVDGERDHVQGAASAAVTLVQYGDYECPYCGEAYPIIKDVQARMADRLRFVSGSFFDHGLPKADVVTMGHILHDWDLPTKKMLLRKAFDAVPAGGAVIVYESIIDDERKTNAFGLMMSLNMLIETPGGFDYTGADCVGWMKETGFSSARVEHLVGPDSMVIGVK